jgi:hypothetical protein
MFPLKVEASRRFFMEHFVSRISTARLLLVSILFTLGVTLLRLVGELRGWSSPWFDKTRAIVGITWILPPVFGFCFAWKLWHEGQRIARIGRAFLLGVLGFALNQLVEATVFQSARISIYSMLLILWAVAIASAYLQYRAWPALCKTLVTYGLGARIPVVIIMFFALRGHWGTHYDRPSGPFQWSFWPTFLWFGFFEELIYWVSFTVTFGALAGSLVAALARRGTETTDSSLD